MAGLRLNPHGVVDASGRRGDPTGYWTPYLRLNSSPQATTPGGPSFYTPTQDFWRDQTKQITEPTPGRRGIFRVDKLVGGGRPAMPLWRRTHAPNGDTEMSLMATDSDGWTDLGGPPISDPGAVQTVV